MNKKQIAVYIATLIFSAVFIVWGYNYNTREYKFLSGEQADSAYSGKITEIVSVEEMGEDDGLQGQLVIFKCLLKDRDMKGKTVTATQTLDDFDQMPQPMVEKGDKVLVYKYSDDDWQFSEYIRLDPLIVLCGIFFAMVVAFGGKKGINTLVSLVITCLAIFMVFVPAVLSGYNIYLWSAVICVFVTVVSMVIINGLHKKTFVAIAGSLCGVTISGGLTLIMNRFLNMTGMLDDSYLYLSLLNPERPIDLNGAIFASIIIGALGAVMDIAMDIATSLYEMYSKSRVSSKQLVKSGFEMGKDMMGTMTTTLVLAYIGSSLAVTVLLVAYNASLTELLNKEMVIKEILQSLVGCVSIMVALPFTTAIAALIYRGKYDWLDELSEEEIGEFSFESEEK